MIRMTAMCKTKELGNFISDSYLYSLSSKCTSSNSSSETSCYTTIHTTTHTGEQKCSDMDRSFKLDFNSDVQIVMSKKSLNVI